MCRGKVYIERLYRWKGGSHINEQQLIAQVKAGDTTAYRELMNRYYHYVYSVAFGIVKHHQDAEDIVQDVFVQMYKSLHYYRYEGFTSWLRRMTINKAIDYKRKKKRAVEELQWSEVAEQIDIEEQDYVESHAIRRERRERIQEELKLIPESYQEIIDAFYMKEQSYAEISAQTGVEIKTVESKLYRARKWLKQHWSREEF